MGHPAEGPGVRLIEYDATKDGCGKLTETLKKYLKEFQEGGKSKFSDILHLSKANLMQSQEDDKEVFHQWIENARKRFEILKGELPTENPPRFFGGVWTAAYSIRGDYKIPLLPKFRDMLLKVPQYRNSPLWYAHSQYCHSYNGNIEGWSGLAKGNDAAGSNFWWAAPSGMFYHLRGYLEDCRDIEPFKYFDFALPIMLVGESLLHASNMAHSLEVDDDCRVYFLFEWEGLKDRRLTSWADPLTHISRLSKSWQEKVRSSLEIAVPQIQLRLPELIDQLTKPLYQAFDLTEVPYETIEKKVTRYLHV